ncbi:MAG: hypothetical protein HUJ26_06550 [Planctomycetaceae bacterium]|nr:hypothetical protein [Planctomycetaceae bacterium]
MIPEPYLAEISPDSIAEQIEQVIRHRTGNSVSELDVYVDSSSIVLNGRTSTYYNKQLATHAAQANARGRLLSNEIEVS